MSNKRWVITFLAVFMVIATILAGINIYIDPFFHYHKPLAGLAYPITIDNERYQNDGIVRNFDYDAIIAGTSMIELFKASEANELFGVNAIKVPHRGATFKEINDNLLRAFEANDNIKLVIRSLDYSCFLQGKDTMNDEADTFPFYLYDNNIFNDVNYVFNMDILYHAYLVYSYTKTGGVTPDFDEYGDWSNLYYFGYDSVMGSYNRPEMSSETAELTEEDKRNIEENFNENVIAIAKAHPETEFYLFITPYSIVYFDNLYREGQLERQLDAERYAISLLTDVDNIHLFSFFNEYDIITSLDIYKDAQHYNAGINSWMLRCMEEGSYELRSDNYESYCDMEKDFYMNYDYDSLFR